jgi:hypothetical protein
MGDGALTLLCAPSSTIVAVSAIATRWGDGTAPIGPG